MMDLDSIKQNTDILDLLRTRYQLEPKRTAGTAGGEYHCPCPICGGVDRFWCHPEQTPQTWNCRGCNNGGTVIDLVMQADNVDFKTACSILAPSALPSSAHPHPRPSRQHGDSPINPPVWKDAGLRIVAECETALWSDAGIRAREWLNHRGLKDETLRAWRVGYNRADRKYHGLYVCRGITIPLLAADRELWGINVRRPVEGKGKYIAVAGSRKSAMLGRLTGKSNLLITEGEFDCMLAWQEAGDLVDVATFGANCVQPGGHWLPYLLPYRRFLLAYDVDGAGAAGAGRWDWTARATRVRLPLADAEGKDITDFWKAGGDLRAWISLLVSEDSGVDTADRDIEDVLSDMVGAMLDAQDRGDTAAYERLLEEANPLAVEVWRRYHGDEEPPDCLL